MDERSILDRALEALRAGGAEGDAWLEQRRTLNLTVREGRMEDLKRAEEFGLAIRAMKGGRLGFVHTSECDTDGAARAAAKACDLAQYAGVRDDLALADPSGNGDGHDEGEPLGIYDPAIDKLSTIEKQEWARSVEAIARGVDPRISKSDGVGYEEDLAEIWLANTKGLVRHYRKSRINAWASVVAEDKGELQTGEIGHETCRWEDLPDPGEFGRKSSVRALSLLGGRPVATGNYPVVFSPEAGFAFLAYLAAALNGDALTRGRSWLSGRSGDVAIGSAAVSVRDDGRLRGGPETVPFDGEGVDTREITLIEAGVVRDNLRDLAAARRSGKGVRSTGSSRRSGYESLPGIRRSNLYLAPGTAKLEDMISGIDRGLWIWGLTGWWIGLDPSNPNFSSAAQGLWIEKGKPAQAVARVTIAGSVSDILGGIDRIADDLVWNASTKTPSFRVKSLSVSGT
jgi:PmbA protein